MSLGRTGPPRISVSTESSTELPPIIDTHVVEIPLVGRDRELGTLRAALIAAAGGTGRLVLLGGEAGIGKTRLAGAMAEAAAGYGVPVLRGHAVDDPGMPPLWLWRRLDLPELRDVLTRSEQVAAADSASARFVMFTDAVDALVAAAGKTGLAIILEDLHWADRTSLRLLAHLARELDTTRLLVVGTYRDAGTALSDALPELVRAPASRTIRLGGLTGADVGRLVRASVTVPDPAGLAARLATGTAGNPLYLRMLLERIADTGDDSAAVTSHPELRRLVLARLEGLPAPSRELLGAASVLGERIESSLLADVTGQDPAELTGLLDEALTSGVLAGADGELAFTHALVRDAVYDDLAPSVRAALHRRFAESLAAGRAEGAAGRIAIHWQRAGGPEATAECARWARDAAEAAIRALAYDEAVQFAELALAASGHAPAEERAELALNLAKAQFLTGDAEATLDRCRVAARLAEEAHRPDLLAAAALVITGLGDSPVLAVVDQLCETALRRLPPEDIALRARLLSQRAMAAAAVGGGERARELSAAAIELARHSGDPDAELDSIHARHLALTAPQFRAERVDLAHRAIAIAKKATQPLAELWGHVWLVDAAFQVGDLAAVDLELDRIEQFAVSGGHVVAWWHLHRLRATKAALLGQLDAAREFSETARAVAERLGVTAALGMYHAFLIQLALLRGTIDPDFVRRSIVLLDRAPDLPLVRIFVPLVHALNGDRDQALATFEQFRTMPVRLEVGPFWAPIMFHIGIVAVLLGDVPTAELVYRRMSTLDPDYLNDGSGAVFCAGASARPLGDLALTCGRTTEAIAQFRLAIEMNARIGARPCLALSRLGLATALVTHGDPADLAAARELAGQAAGECRRLDLPGPLAKADLLLRRIDAAEQSADPLTPREAEVVALVARALTNREIAGELVLSERTVESHVRNILGKLGLHTRTEIATWSLRGKDS